MTDASEKDLKLAEAELAERQNVVTRAQRACLSEIAEGLPAAADALAKSVVMSQTDVTQRLGSDGVKQLRAELADCASQLAATINNAEKVPWPTLYSDHSVIEPGMLRSSLFNYLYGRPSDALAAVFKNYGYDIQDDNAQRSQGLVSPYSLFDEALLKPVAEAMTAVAPARRAVATAKRAHGEGAAEAIWEES